jgi:excisionase family DNA binding protein
MIAPSGEEAAVDVAAIASMLGFSKDTIYRKVRGGEIPGFRLGDGPRAPWRFFPSEVKAHVKAPKADPWAQSARSRSRRRVA